MLVKMSRACWCMAIWGPSDLARNVLANVVKSKLGEGPMTLWFQQTGSLPTRYAIEVMLAPVD